MLESKLLKMRVQSYQFFTLLPCNARILLDFLSFSFPVCENAPSGLTRLILFGLLTALRTVQVLHSPTGHTWKPVFKSPTNPDALHIGSAHLADVSSGSVRQLRRVSSADGGNYSSEGLWSLLTPGTDTGGWYINPPACLRTTAGADSFRTCI